MQPSFVHRGRTVTLACALVALLGACDKVKDATDENPPPAPARGTLVDAPVKTGSYSTSDLLSLLAADDVGRQLARLALSPDCAVDVWRVQYHTVGARDEATTASAALMAPKGTDARCTGARPVLVYDRGTTTNRDVDLSNLSGADSGEALLIAASFAAAGYVVVAPNYTGYATSTLPYHPYLVADAQANDTIDALAAARAAFATATVTASSKLFLTGYSQGGYVAAATHRALQAAGTAVTASAPMSGPYALAAFGDAIFAGRVSASAVVNVTLLTTGYQRSYGNVWASPQDVFAPKYAGGIGGVLPSTTPIATLVQQGQLPERALFPSTPPAAQYASVTPATQPAVLAPTFAEGFGADALVTNAYRLAYLNDAQANPDGGFPAFTTGQPPAQPANALRQALKRNDLRTWTPTSPVLLCGGNEDTTVFWSNTELLQRYWSGAAPNAPVTVLDVDSPTTNGDPYAEFKDAFRVAKAAAALTGSDAVRRNYHAGLVAPVCLAAVKAFFDAK